MSGVEIRQRQLKKGRQAAEEDKRGGPPLHIGLAGALSIHHVFLQRNKKNI